jgi:SsrA-binding protein
MPKLSNRINIENRRAKFDYEFIERLTAGLVLKGTEIKSIREGKAGLADS